MDTILIVDDDVAISKLLEELFRYSVILIRLIDTLHTVSLLIYDESQGTGVFRLPWFF